MKAQFKTKTLLAVAVAAVLPAGSAFAATTSGGTVNFSGKVVTSACAISAGSANIDVDMGEVRTATLAAAGSEASTAKAFSITRRLRNRRYLRLNGRQSDCRHHRGRDLHRYAGCGRCQQPAVGANGGANSAQHVAIRLYDEQGKVVKREPAAAIPLRAGPTP